MEIRLCNICQTPIKVSPSQVLTKKTCSRKCDAILRSHRFAGPRNPSYKGGIATYGKYLYRRGSERKALHREVMEQELGRALNSGEEVHHINGIPHDNRPENLYVIDKRNHSRIHFQMFLDNQRLARENTLLKEELFLLLLTLVL